MLKLGIFRKTETLSEISREIGLVFFAAMVVGPFLDTASGWKTIISGLTLSLGFWSISLWIAHK